MRIAQVEAAKPSWLQISSGAAVFLRRGGGDGRSDTRPRLSPCWMPSREEHLHRVGDRALVRVEVVPGDTAGSRRTFIFCAQRVDARIGGGRVLVVLGRQRRRGSAPTADHVLDAVVAVGGVVERAGLVDDPDRRLLRLDHDALDLVEPVLDLRDAARSRTRRRSGRGTRRGRRS